MLFFFMMSYPKNFVKKKRNTLNNFSNEMKLHNNIALKMVFKKFCDAGILFTYKLNTSFLYLIYLIFFLIFIFTYQGIYLLFITNFSLISKIASLLFQSVVDLTSECLLPRVRDGFLEEMPVFLRQWPSVDIPVPTILLKWEIQACIF